MVRTNLDFMAVDNDVRSMVIRAACRARARASRAANLAISWRWPARRSWSSTPTCGARASTSSSASTTRRRQHGGRRPDALRDALRPVDVQPPAATGKRRRRTPPTGQGRRTRARACTCSPAGPIPPNPGEIVASKRFAAIIQELQDDADIVLVDTPAMLAVGDTSAIAARVDGLHLPRRHAVVKKPQLATAAEQLARLPVKMLGTIVRMYGGKGSRYEYSPYYYKSTYSEDGSKVKERRRRKTDREPGQERAGV